MENTLLKVTSKEPLPEYTHVFQVDDGTVFYYKWARTTKRRLYVKRHGKVFDAQLPRNELFGERTHGDAFYFYSRDLMYKAAFLPTGVIDVSCLRKTLENEYVSQGLCAQRLDGKRYFYRMCDDPDTDGIFAVLSEEEMDGVIERGIIMGKTLYAPIFSSNSRPSAIRRGNVVVVEVPYTSPDHFKSYCPQKSSSFLYFSNGVSLYTLDTITMEFMPSLRFKGINSYFSIVGVHKGVISIRARIGRNWHLATAQLPDGYFQNENTTNELITNKIAETKEHKIAKEQWAKEKAELIQRFDKKIKDMEQREARLKATIEQIPTLQSGIDKLCDALSKCSVREKEAMLKNRKLIEENVRMNSQIREMEELLKACKVGALQASNRSEFSQWHSTEFGDAI